MAEKGIKSNRETYHVIMKQYARRGMWAEVSKLIKQMKVDGIDPNVRTYNILYKYAVILHQWAKCEELWKRIKEIGPSNVSYTLRLRQVAENPDDKGAQGEEVMKEMESHGFTTSAQVYSTLIKVAHDKGKMKHLSRSNTGVHTSPPPPP